MQVLNEHSDAYFNFINSIDSNRTRQSYEFCIQKFLNHYKTDLESLLKLPPNDISNLLKVIPVNFATEHKQMLSHLHMMVTKGMLPFHQNMKN
jgi:hypothetical protein